MLIQVGNALVLYLRSNISGLGWYYTDSLLSVMDKFLLILLLVVLTAEQTLAWWFGANRQWSALLRSDRS